MCVMFHLSSHACVDVSPVSGPLSLQPHIPRRQQAACHALPMMVNSCRRFSEADHSKGSCVHLRQLVPLTVCGPVNQLVTRNVGSPGQRHCQGPVPVRGEAGVGGRASIKSDGLGIHGRRAKLEAGIGHWRSVVERDNKKDNRVATTRRHRLRLLEPVT